MLYFHSWSGGKDSTASVILDHIHGLPPSKIIFSEVMFDKKRGISGELPEHIDFVMNKAKLLFESWGYTVEIVHAEKDYLDLFFHVLQRSKVEERIGKHVGWLLGGACAANRDLKIKPIRDYYKRLDLAGAEYRQYVGIAIDEPKRLERLRGSNKISLLETFGYTEQAAYDLCKEGNKEFMKERTARRPFGNTVLICEYPIDDTAAEEPNAKLITWRLAKRAARDFLRVSFMPSAIVSAATHGGKTAVRVYGKY